MRSLSDIVGPFTRICISTRSTQRRIIGWRASRCRHFAEALCGIPLTLAFYSGVLGLFSSLSRFADALPRDDCNLQLKRCCFGASFISVQANVTVRFARSCSRMADRKEVWPGVRTFFRACAEEQRLRGESKRCRSFFVLLLFKRKTKHLIPRFSACQPSSAILLQLVSLRTNCWYRGPKTAVAPILSTFGLECIVTMSPLAVDVAK